jgi:hypothetical protein
MYTLSHSGRAAPPALGRGGSLQRSGARGSASATASGGRAVRAACWMGIILNMQIFLLAQEI